MTIKDHLKSSKMLKDTPRNKGIREFILKQHLTGFLTDDERAEFWGLPEGCRMRENAKIINPEKLVCGKHVWIGEGAMLDASGSLEIGAHTSIGLNAMIWSHSSILTNLTLDNRPGSDLIERKKTIIGKGCFIGGPSVIFPGITLGDRTVVMPMSVVQHSFSEGNCILSGSPARKIGTIDEKFIEMKIAELKKNQNEQ